MIIPLAWQTSGIHPTSCRLDRNAELGVISDASGPCSVPILTPLITPMHTSPGEINLFVALSPTFRSNYHLSEEISLA